MTETPQPPVDLLTVEEAAEELRVHPQPPVDLLTVEEAAEELRVHPQTVRSLYRSGDLVAIRVGRLVRIPRTSIAAFLARAEAEAEELRSASA